MKIEKALHRIYIPIDEFSKTISFYEKLFDQKCELKFSYKQKRLKFAQIGSVLLLAGNEDSLLPFKDTQVTYLVDSIAEYGKHVKKLGAEILEKPKKVPSGKNMRVRHPDGTIIEYVQHN